MTPAKHTLAANISLMFQEVPLLERIALAKAQGFAGVEVQFPYAHPPQAWKEALEAAGMPLVLINLPAGDFMAGGTGLAAHPLRQEAFAEALRQAEAYVETLRPAVVNVLAGRAASGFSRQACLEQLAANLRLACNSFENHALHLTCEPINQYDQPGYLIARARDWKQLAEQVQHKAFGLQLDLYHAARMEENLTQVITEQAAHLVHIQFADAPGRSPPGSGRIDWQEVLQSLAACGYKGWLAAEFLAASSEDFSWMRLFKT